MPSKETVINYPKYLKRYIKFSEHLSSPIFEQLSTIVSILLLFVRTLKLLPYSKYWRWTEISQSIVQIGIGSLPIIVIATAFAGVVVTNEIIWHIDFALNSTSMVPGFAGQFIVRELGVAIPALLMVSKVGAAITAEIGSMKVTDQIDALKLLGINPLSYLVLPRFIAGIFSGACLTLISIFVTLGCSIGLAVFRYHISSSEYLNMLQHFVGFKDLICALVKGTLYVGTIPIISASYGFRCKGGAEGVGTATTNSVVASTIAIIIFDFILTYLFSLIL